MVDTTLLQAREKPLSLVHTVNHDFYDPYTPTKIFFYESALITTGEVCLSDIFRSCADELIVLKFRHRNQRVNEEPPNQHNYILKVISIPPLENDLDDPTIRNVYSLTMNEHFETIEEIKHFQQDLTLISTPFIIRLEIKLQCIIHYPQPDETNLIVVKRAIEEDQCVVCYEAKPNILFLDCSHLVICEECDRKGSFRNCPMCRTPITELYII